MEKKLSDITDTITKLNAHQYMMEKEMNKLNKQIKEFNAEFLTSPCSSRCLNRQERLDPFGCWAQCSTTGYVGRFCRWLFGCEGYRNDR